ncbi:MAG: hypothetical protein QF847_00195 [Candidatus Marinimicrobia bacterium]|mgnify:FL=1|jgi:hypothetical protein|nr:hypothetical protein [Candidatus Neomarinimicrobiota bacterium]MDP6610712.1 hypothetical protein [Candidatus Neomarinimicrobiota bacterium]MDP6725652.1 hypothetical protein [Candidatus Neomarinimicrobiota bacterium]|tara:strand:- start:72 stop:662 length:591 start_codon:yes stop_codon:yes gene_type:complete
MNNQKTLLISVLVTAVAIGLVETDIIQFNKESIHAQQEFSDLVLEMDGARATIPAGDWVVAVNAWNSDIYAGGELIGVSIDGLLIRERGNDFEMNIPLNDIGSIFHGEYKTVGKYVREGMKKGALGGLGCTALAVAMTVADGQPEDAFFVALCGSIFYGGVGTAAGAVLGFIKSQVAQENAEEFIIGPYDWQIVIE